MNIFLFISLALSPAIAFHHPPSSKRSLRRHFGYPKTRTSHQSSFSSSSLDDRISSPSNQNNVDNRPTIIFPGGGLFFYWQAGVVVSVVYRSCIAKGDKISSTLLSYFLSYHISSCNITNHNIQQLGIPTREQLQSIIQQHTTMWSISRCPISNTSQN